MDHKNTSKLEQVLNLFKPEYIAYNFSNMDKLFPYNSIKASSTPCSLMEDDGFELPQSFTYKDQVWTSKDYLAKSQTSGVIVLQNNRMQYKAFFAPHTENAKHISWSVCKSIISAMIGICLRENFIKNISDEVDKYVPHLKGCGYEGISIKNVLQMSTGIAFDEDYHNPNSDINRLGRVFALGESFDAFVKSLHRSKDPGTFHNYISMDTQVLGMVIREASGMTLSSFLEKYIWEPMGAEDSAYWIKDNEGMEAAFGGLNCSLRDYAKFGNMYANLGYANNKQIIPKQWIMDSIQSSEDHLQPGDLPHLSSHIYGYGYQWWLPESETGEYMAMGVYNQFIYVDPQYHIVIIKNSSNYNFATEKRETTYRHLAFFRAIKHKLLQNGI